MPSLLSFLPSRHGRISTSDTVMPCLLASACSIAASAGVTRTASLNAFCVPGGNGGRPIFVFGFRFGFIVTSARNHTSRST